MCGSGNRGEGECLRVGVGIWARESVWKSFCMGAGGGWEEGRKINYVRRKMIFFSPWNCEVRFLTALTYEPAEFVQIIPGIIVQKKSENWR